MKSDALFLVNALIFIAVGIAFALYGPLVMAFFSIPDLVESDVLSYWVTASFVRLFGAALFGLGLLLWAAQQLLPNATAEMRRRAALALLLTNAMLAFVALTQQVAVWQVLAGWVLSGLFLLLLVGYLIVLIQK